MVGADGRVVVRWGMVTPGCAKYDDSSSYGHIGYATCPHHCRIDPAFTRITLQPACSSWASTGPDTKASLKKSSSANPACDVNVWRAARVMAGDPQA